MANQEYVLAALDMDGTLLNSRHEISDYTRRALCRAGAAGYQIALATGRCVSELVKPLQGLDAVRYLISENGARIYDYWDKRTLQCTEIAPEEVRFILEQARRMDVILQVFTSGRSVIGGEKDKIDYERHRVAFFRSVFETGSIFEPDIADRLLRGEKTAGKINLYFAGADQRAEMLGLLEGHALAVAESIGLSMELSPAGVDKGRGLRALCRALNVDIARTLAVADGGNDLELMRAAGLAVAMGNAIPAVRALADDVTDDCDHDGAAHAIEKYMPRARIADAG